MNNKNEELSSVQDRSATEAQNKVDLFRKQAFMLTMKTGFLGWLAAALTMLVIMCADSTVWSAYTLERLTTGLKVVGAFAGLTFVPTMLASAIIGLLFVRTSLSCLKFVKFGGQSLDRLGDKIKSPTKAYLGFRGVLAGLLTVATTALIYVFGAVVVGTAWPEWKTSGLSNLSGILQITLLIGGYAMALGSWAIIGLGIWHGIKIHNLIHKIGV